MSGDDTHGATQGLQRFQRLSQAQTGSCRSVGRVQLDSDARKAAAPVSRNARLHALCLLLLLLLRLLLLLLRLLLLLLLQDMAVRVMDSNALERERGITILAKNTAIRWVGVFV
jgi:hypothetical protein